MEGDFWLGSLCHSVLRHFEFSIEDEVHAGFFHTRTLFDNGLAMFEFTLLHRVEEFVQQCKPYVLEQSELSEHLYILLQLQFCLLSDRPHIVCPVQTGELTVCEAFYSRRSSLIE